MNMPHSPYMRAIVEAQEEAQDDRTDVQKLHDACRAYLDRAAYRDRRRGLGHSVLNSRDFRVTEQAVDRAFTRIVEVINEQFGDEVDVELLAKALAS